MATVHDVAAYVLDKHGPMTAMKLQKLCFFAYGYHRVWSDEQLFPLDYEAWANGPVSPALYADHRGRYNLDKGEIPGDATRLTDDQRDSVDLVCQALGRYTAHQLSEMTHQGSPWIAARQRAGATSLDRSNEPLLDEEVFDYFSALVSSGSEG
ncbi:type II toxin-antitoxin system antitoxin SocA domain-containing protein [Streptomyces sp. NPDC005180]|uniref:Panacea domain-containing protein n=1 Tax=Streptomyces sp. NPDC005180 TaxID=3156868 RepID=UPI00339E41FB